MSFCIELFCVVTLQYQILVRIAIAYFIIEKKKAAPQPWQAIAQRFCSTGSCRVLYIDQKFDLRTIRLFSNNIYNAFLDNFLIYQIQYTLASHKILWLENQMYQDE